MTNKLLFALALFGAPCVVHGQSFGTGMARVDESIFVSHDTVPAAVPVRQLLMVIDSVPCGDSVRPKARPAAVKRRHRPRVVSSAAPAIKAVPKVKVIKKPRVVTARPRVRNVVRATGPVVTPNIVRTARMCARIRTAGPPEITLLTDTSVVPVWTQALAPPPVALAPPLSLPNVSAPSVIPTAGGHSIIPGLAIVPFFFGPFIHGGHHDQPNLPIALPIYPPGTPENPFPPPTTVPEPGALTLTATGLASLAAAVRRRKKDD